MTDPIDTIPAEWGLGAIPSADDPRDIPISAFIGAPPPLHLDAYLSPLNAAPYRQGATNRCVGFSGAWQRTVGEYPEHQHLLPFDAAELYCAIKDREGQACDPQAGTSIRIGLQVLKDRGAKMLATGVLMPIAAYARLWTDADIKQAIHSFGSAWVATWWPQNWFTPGLVGGRRTLGHPVAKRAGAHAYGLDGWDPFGWRIVNNWGSAWGDNGRAWVSYADFRSQLIEAWRTIDRIEAPEDPMPVIVTERSGTVVLTPGQIIALTVGSTTAGRVPPEYPLVGDAPDGRAVIAIVTQGKAAFGFVVNPVTLKPPAAVDCREPIRIARMDGRTSMLAEAEAALKGLVA